MIGFTCDHFIREMAIVLCGPTISWIGISKRFWRESNGIRSLRTFSKPLAVNEFGMPLPNTV